MNLSDLVTYVITRSLLTKLTNFRRNGRFYSNNNNSNNNTMFIIVNFSLPTLGMEQNVPGSSRAEKMMCVVKVLHTMPRFQVRFRNTLMQKCSNFMDSCC